jgi:DMSO reductase family type II enzyme heme b subunit
MNMSIRLKLTIAALTAAAALGACRSGPVINTQQVVATRVNQELPREDPNSSLWETVPEHPARLLLQDVAEPKLSQPGVELVRVRAMHNGNWVVFRLEWDDRTKNLIPEPGVSSDAAAIQFPEQPGAEVPNAAMGDPGKGVRIWYWKALWQDDAERAQQGRGDRITALHPQGTADHYPYDANPGAKAEMETRYAPARAAGNPITVHANGSPVQVMMAEGFGNVSPAPNQESAGKGVWDNGRWLMTIARPLSPGPGMDTLEPGRRSYIAVAVWDGAAGNTGSRKMRSGWIPLILGAQ